MSQSSAPVVAPTAPAADLARLTCESCWAHFRSWQAWSGIAVHVEPDDAPELACADYDPGAVAQIGYPGDHSVAIEQVMLHRLVSPPEVATIQVRVSPTCAFRLLINILVYLSNN